MKGIVQGDLWRCGLIKTVIRQQKAGGPIGLGGFEQTSTNTCPAFHADLMVLPANPVGHRGPVLGLQGIQ